MGRLALLTKAIVFFIIILLIFSVFQFIPSDVESVFVDKLSADQKEVTLEFDGSDIDGTNLWLEIPVNASVMSASLNVTGLAKNGIYPSNVTVNIGNDEDNDWEFMGTGYGSLGRQRFFSDDTSGKYLMFYNTSFRNDAEIMLPRNATVTNTKLTLEGGTGTYDDFYAASVNYNGEVYYHQSNGDRSFKPASLICDVGGYCYGIGMGDFDNDGDLDLVTGDGGSWSGPATLFCLEKKGIGKNFGTAQNIGTLTGRGYVMDFATGDFDNDGYIDFITGTYSNSLYFFKGHGDLTFTQNSLSVSGGSSYYLGKDAADFNKDGNLDFVAGGSNSQTVFYFQGLGNGLFNNPVQVTVSGMSSWQYCVIADDYNNDGNADIITGDYTNNLRYVQGNGDGTFKTAGAFSFGSYSYYPGDGYDYDFDGYADIVVSDGRGGSPGSEVRYYPGRGNFGFDNYTTLGYVGSGGYCVAAPPPDMIGAENAALDIGDVGMGYDWEYTGILEDYIAQVPDFKQKLNTLLQSSYCKTYRDDFGNEFVIIPLNFSASNDGLLRITNLDIEYSYTATIYHKKDDTIVNELNEHIVYTDTETIKIYFIVTSTSSGRLKFSDLKLTYNIPPDMSSNIPIITAYEDTENLNLHDLSTYFSDTDEPTANLNYSVILNTQAEHVQVFTNFTNILKFRPITENWFGETEVMVQVLDSGLKKTYSNKFKIKVLQVNDEPTTKHQIPDVQLIEGGKEYTMDLDLRDYFTDIENDYLYYSLAIDPKNILKDEQKEISAHIEDNHFVVIQSVDDFNTVHNGTNLPVPIWIYCDDDKDVNTIAYDEGNFTRQEILVRVQPVNDPPQWSSVPSVYLFEDETETFANCIELYPYLHDDESLVEDLILQILSNSNSNIDVSLNKGLISVVAPENYYGSTTVTLRASEPDPTYRADTSFKIEIAPVNDAPSIFIQFPLKSADISGTTELRGSMFDIEGNIQLVEIKIDSLDNSENAVHFDWQQAKISTFKGTEIEYNNNWTYTWDTTTVLDGDYKLSARVYDGELFTETSVNVRVDNGQNKEPIVDITTPYEEEAVNGSVLIRGTVLDPDYHGIEQLQIRIGRDMDWTDIELRGKNGTIDWYYQWDSTVISDGSVVISAKAYDGRSWSAPVNRMVKVNNGINDTTSKTSGIQDKDEEINWIFLTIIILIVVMIIIGLLAMFLIIRRGKKQIHDFVPDGRLEPLEDVEVKLRPALGQGVEIEHAPALPAAQAGATSSAIAATPALPATTAQTIAPSVPVLPPPAPAANVETNGSADIPALPPHIAQPISVADTPAVAKPAIPADKADYGLYSPQAKIAETIPPLATPKYQPQSPGTTSPAQHATPVAKPAANKEDSDN